MDMVRVRPPAPGARLPPSNDGAGKIDRLYDDITTETHRNNSKTIEKEERRSDNADREVDLEAIRNKLKTKETKVSLSILVYID